MFVGIGGNIGQYFSIVDLCKKYKLKLILDAAHMAGTKIAGGKHVGSEADVTVFSFQAVKNLPTADSGMICFKNEDYDVLARKLSWLGIDKDTYNRTNDKGTYKWEYDLVDVGFKYHGNSIIASMALVGLKYLEEDNKRRREICEIYESYFKKTPIKSIQMSKDTAVASRHLYQIIVPNRNKIMEYLNTQGIYPGVHYRDNTCYDIYSYNHGTCPMSHTVSEELISLPLHMKLTNEDIKYVAEKVIEGYNLFV
jgi:dTDP-4-amino-4,6-dideoxygalactose transaminase